MKSIRLIPAAALALLVWFWANAASAQLIIPSDGTDGAFHPTESIVIDLARAITGNWDDPVLPADRGRGIYDRNQWAIVFKYESVTIPAGVTVSFTNHPSRAPVVWLVQGNVTIIGPGNGAAAAPALNLNGAPGTVGDDRDVNPEAGPGGFRSGAVNIVGNRGSGLGVGGGNISGFAQYLSSYGNPRLVPLIGGSGGSADPNAPGGSSGGAGGAILIASSGSVTISGKIHANAGLGGYSGTGGAVRIVANSILGAGEIRAMGMAYSSLFPGRIRLETLNLSPEIGTVPETVGVAPDPMPVIWPPSNAPKVRVVSVAAAPAPEDPTANLSTGADIGLQNNGSVEILIETTNFPIEGIVQVRRAAKFGGFEWHKATYLDGNNARATWGAQATFSPGFTTLQARATAP